MWCALARYSSCSSPISVSSSIISISFCTLPHNSRHFSFLICHFSFLVCRLSHFSLSLPSLSLCLSVCLFDAFNKFQQMSVDEEATATHATYDANGHSEFGSQQIRCKSVYPSVTASVLGILGKHPGQTILCLFEQLYLRDYKS